MSAPGYVKSYRAIFDHWVSDDPKTFMAWQEITHFAAFADRTIEASGQVIQLQRGQVNISGLKSRRYFTDKQWRSFLERLVECNMISRSSVHPLGRGYGSIAIYDVVAYEKYQSGNEERYDTLSRSSVSKLEGRSNGMSKGVAKGGSNERPEQDNYEVEGRPKGMSKGMSKGAPYTKEFQEVKNITPPTPPEREPGEGYETNILQTEHPDIFRLLCRIKSIANANTPQFQAWSKRVLDDCRTYSPETIKPILEDMTLSWGSLNMPWKYYEKQREDSKKSSARSKIQFGDVVFHPDYGEFVADTQALYEDAWMSPEGNYVFANTLRVVRSTHA